MYVRVRTSSQGDRVQQAGKAGRHGNYLRVPGAVLHENDQAVISSREAIAERPELGTMSPETFEIERDIGGAAMDKLHKNATRVAVSNAIIWLESLRLPRFMRNNEDGVPIINGLDRVLFGRQAAAEVVTILGVHPPRYLCYMVSGFVCDLIQFVVDVFLHLVLKLEDASLCWALGFGISVSFRHTSHRYLVFGDYVGGYWASLGRMYAGYSIIIVLSTIFNIVMTKKAQLPHYVAWVITLLWTGIVNYFILKKLWTFGGKEKKNPEQSISDEEKQEIELSSSERADVHGPKRR